MAVNPPTPPTITGSASPAERRQRSNPRFFAIRGEYSPTDRFTIGIRCTCRHSHSGDGGLFRSQQPVQNCGTYFRLLISRIYSARLKEPDDGTLIDLRVRLMSSYMALSRLPIRGLIAVVAAIVALFSPQIAVDRYHNTHDYLQAIVAVPFGVVFGITALRASDRVNRGMGLAGLVICGTVLLNMLFGYLSF